MITSGPINVRDARTGDAETIVEFNCLMALETENKTLDPAVVRRGVQLGLQRPDQCRYFVAEVYGRVVGQCMVTYEWSDWRAGVIWWFQSVYVHADHRRKGVFTALYRHVETLARSHRDVRCLRLYVEQDNERARETYRRLGMTPSGHVVYEVDWSNPS